MVSFILSAVALALSAAAAPASTAIQGDITYYEPGIGACGWYSEPSLYVAAVANSVFDSIHPCGRFLRISANGRSLDLEVVDRCPGCAANQLEISESAFVRLYGGLGTGRYTGDWEFI